MNARSLVPTSLGEVAQPFKKLINKSPKRINWTMAYERFFIDTSKNCSLPLAIHNH
jgi:hypothetical protein